MEQQVLAVAAGCLAVVVIITVALLARQRQTSVRLRGRVAVLEGGMRLRDEELAHLVSARLPALGDALYGHPVQVPGALHPKLTDTPYGKHLDQVTQMVTEAREQA